MKRVNLTDKNGNGQTDVQLRAEAERLDLRNFRGVFMRDELKHLKPLKRECGILNLNLSSQEGSHWVCWFKNANDKFYFDSFGVLPPIELVRYLKRPILYSSYEIQDFADTNCGNWCLYVLNKLNQGADYTDIILEIIRRHKLY